MSSTRHFAGDNPCFKEIDVTGLSERVTRLFNTEAGQQLLEEVEANSAAENAKRHSELAAEYVAEQGQLDAQAAKLQPKIQAAEEDLKKAIAVMTAKRNAWGYLNRQMADIDATARRKLSGLAAKLAVTSDSSIDAFIVELDRVRERVLTISISEREEPATEKSGWLSRVFSNRPSIEKRLELVEAARTNAEALKLLDADVDAELAKIRATLPRGEVEQVEVASMKVEEAQQ